jgi:glycosyltransferase involved in cell wall biosynthesis
MIKVSVVIPAFNEEKLIGRCLKSLEKQTMKRGDYEIIVVDNNSTDKTAQIAKKYADKVVKEKRKGILFARQKGCDEAQAEIILRTDADGYVPKDWIKKGYNYLTKNKKTVAVSGFYFPDNKDMILTEISKMVIEYKDLIWKTIDKAGWLTGSCSGFKKTAFKKIKGFDLKADPVIEDQQGIAHRLRKIGKVDFCKNWWVWYSPRRINSRKNNVRDFANDYFLYQMLNNLYYFVFKKHPKKVLGKWKDIRE